MPVVRDFKSFLTKTNALALAVGVIIGAATGKVVSGVVDDVLMPIVGLVLPKGDWREAKIVLSTGVNAKGETTENAIRYGHLIGTFVDFFFVALVVFLITKALLREKPKPVTTKECPRCKEAVPLAATRCRACTSELSPV